MENSEIILKYIDNHKGTAYQIAKSTGISESTISKWRKNPTSKIDVSVVQKIAAFYNITTSELLDENQASLSDSISNDKEQLLKYYNELDDLDKRSVLGKAEGLAEAARRRKAELEAATKEKAKPKPKAISLPTPEPEPSEDIDDEDEDGYIYLPLSYNPASAGTGVYLEGDYVESVKVRATPEARRSDFAVKVSGDSMEPRFCDGDIVLVSKEPVEIGETGIFVYEGDGYIKQLGKDCLISINPAYPNIPIKYRDSFFCQGKVVAVLSPNKRRN